MRLNIYSSILTLSLLSSASAHNGLYVREVDALFSRGQEVYQHYQRHTDFISELTIRELVEELEARLVRRAGGTPPESEQQTLHKAGSNGGTPMQLEPTHDKQILKAFAQGLGKQMPSKLKTLLPPVFKEFLSVNTDVAPAKDDTGSPTKGGTGTNKGNTSPNKGHDGSNDGGKSPTKPT
ncbi:hypothetical protein CVT24_012790 [Panaeolus cyanescens]|uniref:Uncharacterized protein n=1 Tax=Panaeolus cyanescens TaxID=181874 RepID=A0A409W5W4_9AGAR|nr:hypothetical protein CVT24_012790 [Panaeolus cyanescens]